MLAIGALKEGFSEWHVAANGTQSGKGSIGSPLDLTTALSGGTHSARIKPGDLVWIRGGRYPGSFKATAAGTVDAPIHFRQYPGERAILEKTEASREVSTLSVQGPYVWFWDLEITNSFANRQRLDPQGELNPWRGSGINVWAPNTKYINLVIHDNGHGFGLWNEDGGTEIYGCLIYNNGNNKKEHGIYAHSKIGTQVFADNVIFNNAGYGLHIYANSIKSSISGFDIQGNVIFNNGALTGVDQVADQVLVGGVTGVSASRINLRENYVYNPLDAPTSKSRGVRLGYEDRNNRDVALVDNHIISKVPLKILWWEGVKVRGNTVVSGARSVEIETPSTSDLDYIFESNRYVLTGNNASPFLFNKLKLGLEEWNKMNNLDVSGRVDFVHQSSPQPAGVFVRANKFDRRRANLIITNINGVNQVSVNLNSFLRVGDTFEIRDIQNYFGLPEIRGVYDGREVIVKLNAQKVILPTGEPERMPVHTRSEFGIFALFRIGR